jgi:multicomponent Na+:H+ antiporter subunit C
VSAAALFGAAAATLIGVGLFGVVAQASWLRRIVSMNVLCAGIFLLYGVVARRGATADLARDPVPQALVITGIVVAFAGTALAIALRERLAAARERGDVSG